MILRIGTSGYSYPAWVGPFYPPGTASARMLGEYARHFPAVEINNTYYRPPTVEQADNMARRTPPGFGFTLKVPKTASHDRSPHDLPAMKAAADRLAAAGKLLGLLVQVPESFHHTPRNGDWLKRVADQLRPHPVAVEFRHRSWDFDRLPDWLAAAGLDLVSVGVPAIPSLFPAGLRVVNRKVYARLHSQDAQAWYAGEKARYDYDYPDAVIRKWAGALYEVADQADEALFFFNNCVGAQAVENARALWAAVRRLGPAVAVIDPLVPPYGKGQMPFNPRAFFRKAHRWGAAVVAAPFLLVIVSGLLLQVKKQVSWVQPPTVKGSAKEPAVSFDAILAAVKGVPEAEVAGWADVDRVDLRPRDGTVKVTCKSRWEVQVDAATGKVLQVEYRRSDLIESLHDGSWFGDPAKLYVFLPAGAVVLGLWLTGAYLFVLPYSVRWRRRAGGGA